MNAGQPRSGLLELVEGGITGILAREQQSDGVICLYRSGAYWTAFECSAYRLSLLCPDALVIPMKVEGVSFPVVTAHVEGSRLEAVARHLSCRKKDNRTRMYDFPDTDDDGAYRNWHDRQAAGIARAVSEGVLAC